MNREETIAQIKTSLKRLFTVEHKFAEYTTNDGMTIKCEADKLDVGVKVNGVDEMGNLIPLDNGSYELNNGYVINVVDGSVESISEVPHTEEDMGKVGETVTPSTDNKSEEMAKKVQMIEAQLAECLSLMKEVVKGQEKMQSEVYSEIEDLKKQPAENAFKGEKKGSNGFIGTFNKVTKMNELDEIRKLISDKNKNNNNLVL